MTEVSEPGPEGGRESGPRRATCACSAPSVTPSSSRAAMLVAWGRHGKACRWEMDVQKKTGEQQKTKQARISNTQHMLPMHGLPHYAKPSSWNSIHLHHPTCEAAMSCSVRTLWPTLHA